MSTIKMIEYKNASERVKKVYDDIMNRRNTNKVNNIWKALANHPDLLESTWFRLKEVMQPGALDASTKELIYIAVSIANSRGYCVHSHSHAAREKGVTEDMIQELLEVVSMASQTNSLANAYQLPIDEFLLK